ADKSAAVIDKSFYRSDNTFIRPVFPSGIGCICVSHIEKYIEFLKDFRILPNIVKTDKFHIKGRPAKCFDNPCIGIILFIVNGVMDHMIPPGPHLSPAVKDSHLFDAVWGSAFDVLIQGPELVADLFYIINKLRELHSQFQISSISDPVNRLSQDCSS